MWRKKTVRHTGSEKCLMCMYTNWSIQHEEKHTFKTKY